MRQNGNLLGYNASLEEYCFDGWKRKEVRVYTSKKLGLDSDCLPGYSSLYSHGRSVGFTSKWKMYEVEMLMGSILFRKRVFKTTQFSTYFEGYGLYEDTDFTLSF
jgi:hypothetical protein